MVRVSVISTKQLVETTKYNYCPYCMKEQKRTKTDLKLETLFRRTVKIEKKDKVIFESFWFCKRCKRKLTSNDFVLHYCKKPDGFYSKEELEIRDEKIDE